jgi:hypothetical protein
VTNDVLGRRSSGAVQIGVDGATEIGTHEIVAGQVRAPEVGFRHIGVTQVCTPQVRIREIGCTEVSATEVGMREIDVAEIQVRQVGRSQIGSRTLGTRSRFTGSGGTRCPGARSASGQDKSDRGAGHEGHHGAGHGTETSSHGLPLIGKVDWDQQLIHSLCSVVGSGVRNGSPAGRARRSSLAGGRVCPLVLRCLRVPFEPRGYCAFDPLAQRPPQVGRPLSFRDVTAAEDETRDRMESVEQYGTRRNSPDLSPPTRRSDSSMAHRISRPQ